MNNMSKQARESSIEDPEEEDEYHDEKYAFDKPHGNLTILDRQDTETAIVNVIDTMKETETQIMMNQIKNHTPLKNFVQK